VSVPESDRLLVAKKNIARCAWCGTPESNNWVTTQYDGIFCSPECRAARYSTRSIIGGIIFSCIGLLFVVMPLLALVRNPVPDYQSGSIVGFMFSGVLLGLCGIWMMAAGGLSRKYLVRKGQYSDIALLECEYCLQANPPSNTRCQYCGAPLTRAPFAYDTMPPWIQGQMMNEEHLARFRCPRCNAIYSYDVSKVESDGSVRCQNCLKPFVPPYPIPDRRESEIESHLYSDV
jgi:predicted Zn finger-like uncharacterized protein